MNIVNRQKRAADAAGGGEGAEFLPQRSGAGEFLHQRSGAGKILHQRWVGGWSSCYCPLSPPHSPLHPRRIFNLVRLAILVNFDDLP